MAEYRKDPDAIARLTPEQYAVTQQNGTEAPFANEFDDHTNVGFTWT